MPNISPVRFGVVRGPQPGAPSGTIATVNSDRTKRPHGRLGDDTTVAELPSAVAEDGLDARSADDETARSQAVARARARRPLDVGARKALHLQDEVLVVAEVREVERGQLREDHVAAEVHLVQVAKVYGEVGVW